MAGRNEGHLWKLPEVRFQVNPECMLPFIVVQRMRGHCGGVQLLHVDELDTSEWKSFNKDLWSGHGETGWPRGSLASASGF